MHSTLGNMPHSMDNIERIDKPLPLPNQNEDLREYTFAKFASTYFQGNATPHYSKKTLRRPLLAIKSERDQLWKINNFLIFLVQMVYLNSFFFCFCSVVISFFGKHNLLF